MYFISASVVGRTAGSHTVVSNKLTLSSVVVFVKSTTARRCSAWRTTSSSSIKVAVLRASAILAPQPFL
jgi:hypothetical protein